MLIVAHRTLADVEDGRRLAAAGANVFEVDVQLRDDHIAVSHFLPVTATRGLLQHDNWRLRRRAPDGGDPRLPAVVAAVPADGLILLDPKETSPSRRTALLDAVVAHAPDPTRYLVSTSWTEDLARYRAAGFGTWRTVENRRQLTEVLAAGVLLDRAVTVRHTLLDAVAVARLHDVVGEVVVWTVNQIDRARRLRDYGVDGVTTDSLDVMRALSV